MSHSRLVFALLIVSILAGCARPEQDERAVRAREFRKAGWHYIYRETGEVDAAIYRFADNSPYFFMARCAERGVVSFDLHHDGHVAIPPASLEIDDRRWAIDYNSFETHSGDIMLSSDQFGDQFRGAKSRIGFRVGKTFHVQFPPAPLLGQLIDRCRSNRGNAGETGAIR